MTFVHLGMGMGIGQINSQLMGMGMEMKTPIPNFWEWERVIRAHFPNYWECKWEIDKPLKKRNFQMSQI